LGSALQQNGRRSGELAHEAWVRAEAATQLQAASVNARGHDEGDGPTLADECNVEEVDEGNSSEHEGEKGVGRWERPIERRDRRREGRRVATYSQAPHVRWSTFLFLFSSARHVYKTTRENQEKRLSEWFHKVKGVKYSVW